MTEARFGKHVTQLQGSDPYEAAIAWMESLGHPRHHVNFEGYRQGCFYFGPGEMPPIQDEKRWLLAMAHDFGFPLAGITKPQLPQRYYDRFEEWLRKGGNGGMDFLARQKDKRLHPSLVSKSARSVLAVATPYSNVKPGIVARYATGDDYHQLLSKRLDLMKRAIYRDFPDSRLYSSVDTGPILERAYAEQAGLGWIGKNGVLISRTHGSYLSLATLWVPFELQVDEPHEEFCGSCTDCLSGCPTQAISQPGWVEANKCIAYWTIEHPGETIEDPHGWLFGCDVCQEVCPWNKFSVPPVLQALQAKPESLLTPQDWHNADDATLQTRIAHSPLRRVGIAGIRRNARRLLNVLE